VLQDPLLMFFLALALVFDFLNGFHDSANIVAVVITSRAMGPRQALLWTALGEFLGPLLFGVAVAHTIGAELLAPEAMSLETALAALLAAIAWNLFTWWLGLPSSSSHALIGGLVGAGVASWGWRAVQWAGLRKVLLALLISPPAGFAAGYLLTRLTLWLAQAASPRINTFFRVGQIATSFALALSHGANDAQKTMGLMTLALLSRGYLEHFEVPQWVILTAAGAIALGTSVGGWSIIRTLGGRIFRVRPMHGFLAQLGGGVVIATAAWLGGPVSTTHVMSSAILGTGAAERWRQVRWGVVRDMLWAWFLTLPACAGLAMGLYMLLQR